MQFPVNYINITNTFGNGHYGVDFGRDSSIKGATATQPIYAVDDGVVISIQKQKTGGNVLIIRHDNGFVSEYAHCSKIIVKVGDKVKKGEYVANMGSTGEVTGPHLHFGLYKGKTLNYRDRSKFVNPLKYLIVMPNQIISPKSKVKDLLTDKGKIIMYVDNTDYEGVWVHLANGKRSRIIPIGTKLEIVKIVGTKAFLDSGEYVSTKCLSNTRPLLNTVVSKNGLNVRDSYSTKGKIISVLKDGAKVKVYKTYKGWSKISPNTEAWVSSNYLR